MNSIKILIISFIIPFFVCSMDVFDHVDKNSSNITPKDVFETLEDSDIIYNEKAKIIVMNKITAIPREFMIDVGSTINYGKAVIEVHKCGRIKDSDDNFILVSLNENLSGNDSKLIFRGWIFSRSLSLSAVEHPIYQLIAVGCI